MRFPALRLLFFCSLVVRSEVVGGRIVRDDFPPPLQPLLELAPNIRRRLFRNRAPRQGAQRQRKKEKSYKFHLDRLQISPVLARKMQRIPPVVLIDAYSQGLFPMGMDDGSIGWFFPERRGILPLLPQASLHLPHGVRKDLRRFPWQIRQNTSFRKVMSACAERKKTWIDDTILDSYCHLHELGHAHSLEVWLDDQLVGGLYGVHLGGAFFGESMFHRVTGASKVALVALIGGLYSAGFSLLDTQWTTAHLAQFGAVEVLGKEYLLLLQKALRKKIAFPDFSATGLPAEFFAAPNKKKTAFLPRPKELAAPRPQCGTGAG